MKEERYPYINNPYGYKLPDRKHIIHPIITKWNDFTEEDKNILQNIKKVITSYIEEDCKIFVYGSRIKGTWDENSDYDIAINYSPSFEIQKQLIKYDYGVKVDLSFRGDMYNKSDVEIE